MKGLRGDLEEDRGGGAGGLLGFPHGDHGNSAGYIDRQNNRDDVNEVGML